MINNPYPLIFSGLSINYQDPMNLRRLWKMEDKKIICKDCGKEFIFTVGEQEFYKEKGFENDPVRCPDCRRARKAQKINREKR